MIGNAFEDTACEACSCGVVRRDVCPYAMDDSSIRVAVDAWVDGDRAAALATYGDISTWDTSAAKGRVVSVGMMPRGDAAGLCSAVAPANAFHYWYSSLEKPAESPQVQKHAPPPRRRREAPPAAGYRHVAIVLRAGGYDERLFRF